MAMIQCPECGNSISDKAKNCPHCGAPINETPMIPVEIFREFNMAGGARKMDVYCDGALLGRIAVNNGFKLELEPGFHTLVLPCMSGGYGDNVENFEVPFDANSVKVILKMGLKGALKIKSVTVE